MNVAEFAYIFMWRSKAAATTIAESCLVLIANNIKEDSSAIIKAQNVVWVPQVLFTPGKISL